jgi:predicted unusual protein kinase regulating ubiquinone biosynthesis (AarF/ABC1/UbiB family)
MLDTGMVTNLSHDNHINLMRLLMSVVIKDEKDCCNAVRKIALGVDEV